jgi:cob(I)alamin adenosyltransferase
MKLYTKSGDDGSTGLFGGPRVPKCDPRVAAYGEVDEINAAIGMALVGCNDPQIAQRLAEIQADLFVVGAELATPQGHRPPNAISESQIAQLEQWIDEACDETKPLRTFVLPGGTALAAALHLARTVCRRAERAVVSLSQEEAVSSTVVVYLNRLSDLLFAWARLANQRAGVADIPWNPPRT